MKPNKKAKWVVGITGTALSAFILSQLDSNPNSDNQSNQANQSVAYQTEVSAENTNGVSDREKELANKDWSNFTVEPNTNNQSTNQSATNSSVNQPAVQQQPVAPPPTNRNTSRS